MRKKVKRVEKDMQKSILTEISTNIDNARQKNGNSRTPHGFLHNLVNETVVVLSWITYDMMMNFHRENAKRDSKILAVSFLSDTVDDNENVSRTLSGTTNTKNATGIEDYKQLRNKAGRLVGITKKRKRADDIAIIANTNDMVVTYKRVPRKYHQRSDIKKILEEVIFNKHKIRHRLWRGTVYLYGYGGHNYPILPMEPTIIKTILHMARI